MRELNRMAVSRRDEVQVSTNETIEAHVQHLHTDVKSDLRELRTDQKALRDKIDHNHASLSAGQNALRDKIDHNHASLSAGQDALRDKIDHNHASLSADQNALRDKIDHNHASLSADQNALRERLGEAEKDLRSEFNGKFEEVNDKVDALGKDLGGRIEKLSHSVAELRGLHKTVLWVCGGFLTLVVAAVTIGQALGWIGPPAGGRGHAAVEIHAANLSASGRDGPLAQPGRQLNN